MSGSLTGYAALLDLATLRTVLLTFRRLHPALLPIFVFEPLTTLWVGDLSEDQVRQALRDCYDLCEAALSAGRSLYSPRGFVEKHLRDCLQNQVLEGWLVEQAPPVPIVAIHSAAS